MRLSDLSIRDVGNEVSITWQGATIKGRLGDFRVETEWIHAPEWAENPHDIKPIPGRHTVSLSVGPWSASGLPVGTPVEVW
jgi:hypothetical protein